MMRWLFCLPCWAGFNLLAMLAAPILPLFADDEGWLPGWLWWFQTPDNSLDGDAGWRSEHCLGWPRHLKRVLWLWRNPAYGFELDGPLAARIAPRDYVDIAGNPWIKNRERAICMQRAADRVLCHPARVER